MRASRQLSGTIKDARFAPAVARFRKFQNLRQELEETKTRLADRKIIEKAKGLLMKKKNMGEEQAYQFLRRTAMSRNLQLIEVARVLISLEETLD